MPSWISGDGCIKINDWAEHYTLDVKTDIKFNLYTVEPPLMSAIKFKHSEVSFEKGFEENVTKSV